MEIKFTKISGLRIYKDGSVHWFGAHFKVNGIDHFMLSSTSDYEPRTQLYRGRCKCHLDILSGCGRTGDGMIRFIKKKGCLKYIDTEFFLQRIEERGLWPSDDELWRQLKNERHNKEEVEE